MQCRYADKLVEHAKQMLEFGMEHPGSYMKSKLEGLKDHGKHYPSTNYNDEMALGAVWLYFATGVSPSSGLGNLALSTTFTYTLHLHKTQQIVLRKKIGLRRTWIAGFD